MTACFATTPTIGSRSVENVLQFTWATLAALIGRETTAGKLMKRRCLCCACMQRFHGDEVHVICMEALEGEISNLVAWNIRWLQAGFSKDKIKCGLMLMREIPWSLLPVEQAHAWLYRFQSQTPSDDGL